MKLLDVREAEQALQQRAVTTSQIEHAARLPCHQAGNQIIQFVEASATGKRERIRRLRFPERGRGLSAHRYSFKRIQTLPLIAHVDARLIEADLSLSDASIDELAKVERFTRRE